MAQGKDAAQEQNISQVLEMLKRSYSENSDEDTFAESATEQETNDAMSAEDLQKQLKMQYSADKDEYSEMADDSYHIDTEFLTEAEKEPEEEPEEEIEEEPEEELEEEPEEEIEEEIEEEVEEEIEEEIEEEVEEELEADDSLSEME